MASAPESERRDVSQVTILLIICGIVGLILIFTGIGFFIFGGAWTPLVDWLREGTREALWKTALAVGSILIGTLVTMLGLQSARKYERTDPLFRRVIYGFNVYVQLQMLGWVLAIANLGVDILLPGFLDTTAGGFFLPSEKTREYIEQLDRPVQIYMVIAENTDVYLYTQGMLQQMHDFNPKYFKFEEVSPSLTGATRQLKDKYPLLTEQGLIVSYGDAKDNYSFIPATELESQEFDFTTGRRKQRQYNGEVRLMQELYYLGGGKKKPVIYFTQDHDEPGLFESGENGLSVIRERLTRANYQVRPLSFPNDETKVPDDADVVVVVGPTLPMRNALPALKEYMSSPTRKGKLVVLLGRTPPSAAPGNTMRQIGLEDWLRTDWSADITNEMIYTYAFPQGLILEPTALLVLARSTNEAVATHHPLAQNFQKQILPWYLVRQVKPVPGKPALQAEAVMSSFGPVWTETDRKVNPDITSIRLAQDSALARERVKQDRLPVVVTVKESSPDPHAFSQSNRGQTPRLVVIGCSDMATNQLVSDSNFDFLRGSIDWCRERYGEIGIQPKTHQNYTVPTNVKAARILWLPALVIFLSIGGLGLVVWNIRRR
ncbi:MAG TPA: Gldg family protein [Gemmataceae bacterium]|jgi:hypothetical protein|nr:Gldg family protein [Gemmataceae bacterium]